MVQGMVTEMNTVKLSRTASCVLFQIRFPIWNGGKRAVGLAEDRLGRHNEIQILYTRKSGERAHPDNYYFDGNLRMFFETMTVKGRKLILIPMESLQKLEREGL